VSPSGGSIVSRLCQRCQLGDSALSAPRRILPGGRVVPQGGPPAAGILLKVDKQIATPVDALVGQVPYRADDEKTSKE
jgi:hypothetical protein